MLSSPLRSCAMLTQLKNGAKDKTCSFNGARLPPALVSECQ